MFDKIVEADRSLLLFLNSLHFPLGDKIMLFFTAALPWIPLYIAIAYYIVHKYYTVDKKPKYAFIVITAAIIVFAITDMGSSFIKDLTERYRPGHDNDLKNMVRLLDGTGGRYGFVSSHASNVFGLATFTSLLFRKRYYSISIYTWAFLVSYSRIYVGRHFPADVFFGAILGMIAGYALYKLLSMRVIKKYYS